MNHKLNRSYWIAALGLLLAGCAAKEYGSMRPDQASWLKADPQAANLAEDAEAPSIDPRTYFAAGQLFEQQGDLHKAVTQYRKALAADPDYVPAYNRLGVLFGRLGQHPEAEHALTKAVEIRPDWAFLRNNLGFEYVLQERWKDAEVQLREAVRLQPNFLRAHNNLGMVLFKQGRVEESLLEFKRAVPEADAYYNLGLMFRGEERYDEAALAFERVLALAPTFQAANIQLVEITPYLDSGMPDVASAEMEDWDAAGAPSDKPKVVERDLQPAEEFDAATAVTDSTAPQAPAEPLAEAPVSPAPLDAPGAGYQPAKPSTSTSEHDLVELEALEVPSEGLTEGRPTADDNAAADEAASWDEGHALTEPSTEETVIPPVGMPLRPWHAMLQPYSDEETIELPGQDFDASNRSAGGQAGAGFQPVEDLDSDELDSVTKESTAAGQDVAKQHRPRSPQAYPDDDLLEIPAEPVDDEEASSERT